MDRCRIPQKKELPYQANFEEMNQRHPGLRVEIGPHEFCTNFRPLDNGNRFLLDHWLDSSLGIELAETDRLLSFYGCMSLSS